MEENKLLIISHNIIDNSNNVGKTVISILKKWPTNSIRSIYLRNEVRNTMLCDDSYRITDGDVLKNTLHFKPKNCGKRIELEEKRQSMSGSEGAYRLGNKRYPIISLIRDLLWHKKSWKTDSFKSWIKEEQTDMILFIPNDYVLAFEIADYVKDLTKAPMITFFTDDSFYYNQKTTLVDSIRRRWLRKVGDSIVKKSDGMICASHLMQEEYKHLFNKDSVVLGNCVEITQKNKEVGSGKAETFVFTYIGNLHSNRWKSILEIGYCLEKIKNTIEKDCVLNVYTASDLGKLILSKLEEVSSIKLMGAVPPKEVKGIQEKSDGLVHVEAFDYKSKLSTRLSMSTKIFEYMSRNVPVFAYGPEDISSMYFLKNGKFACTCNSQDELYDRLMEFITDIELRDRLRMRAYSYARENFEEDKISSGFKDFAKQFIAE